MNYGHLGLDFRSLQGVRAPEFTLESEETFVEDSSYTVKVRSVNWKNIRFSFRFNYPFSEPDSLIKYSEERYSPVSAQPSDCIQLGTPSYFKTLGAKGDSELIADELEFAYVEELRQNEKGSEYMERLKKNPIFRHVQVKVKRVVRAPWFSWLYSTAIDPIASYKRRELSDYFSSNYNFMTKIDNPLNFAKQLGRDFAKQVALSNDLRWKARGDYEIFVEHGPAIYLDGEKIERAMQDLFYEQRGYILPFVKRTMYQEQQEYRFLIRVLLPGKVCRHDLVTDTFLLKTSDELRNLMAPIGADVVRRRRNSDSRSLKAHRPHS